MNALPDFLAGASGEHWFDTLHQRLLASLDDELPCGPPARHDPMVTAIRLLREEDEPSLPMGQWERPLKLADWPQIEQHCIVLLCERSKDLQTVVWLIEAWVRQRGFIGLGHGLQLLDTLLRRYWDALHPVVEDDGDCDARLAPLEWLNATLSTGVRVHAALVTLPDWRPPEVSLADWERLAVADADPGAAGAAVNTAAAPARRHSARDGDVALTRTDLFAAAGPAQELAATQAAIEASLASLESIASFLAQRLQAQAPPLLKLHQVLAAAHRVMQQVQAARPVRSDWPPSPPSPLSVPLAAGAPPVALPAATAMHTVDEGDAAGAIAAACVASVASVAAAAAAPAMAAAPVTGGWRNRNDAYVTLQALTEFLAQLEPHSPTPFLLRRAVRWGSMPLPEVLAEVLREEGDLNRLVNVLGLQT
jgi:type VI secretion system protein ImpA